MPYVRTIALSLMLAAGCANEANLRWDTGTAYYDRDERRLSVNGIAYDVPETTLTGALTTGDRVRVRWEEVDGRRVATNIRITGRRVIFQDD